VWLKKKTSFLEELLSIISVSNTETHLNLGAHAYTIEDTHTQAMVSYFHDIDSCSEMPPPIIFSFDKI
jgi:hypothetical protein